MIIDLTQVIPVENVPASSQEQVVPIWGEAAPSGVGIVEMEYRPAQLEVRLAHDTGTHIHFPSYFDPGGRGAADYRIEDFVNSAVVVDLHREPRIDPYVEALIFYGGSDGAQRKVLEQCHNIRLVGMAGHAPRPHGRDILLLENLQNIERLYGFAGPRPFRLVSVPLPYRSGATAHVRAYAEVR